MTIHTDEAFDFLIGRLAAIPEYKDPQLAASARNDNYGCDVWLPQIALAYWQASDNALAGYPANLRAEQCQPFYDAAWDLCRIGVLRPGQVAPLGTSMAQGFHGDGYSITAFGRTWLQDARDRPIIDPSRLSEGLRIFGKRFGDGYAQRATEAVKTYRTINYLAACVMAGAAAKSILLAVAIAKEGDESKVVADYKNGGGRSRVTKRVLNNVSLGIAIPNGISDIALLAR